MMIIYNKFEKWMNDVLLCHETIFFPL